MMNIYKKGILVLLVGLSLVYGLSLDGIDIIDTLILSPIALISLFYFISPLFLGLKQIEALDNWFDDLLQ